MHGSCRGVNILDIMQFKNVLSRLKITPMMSTFNVIKNIYLCDTQTFAHFMLIDIIVGNHNLEL